MYSCLADELIAPQLKAQAGARASLANTQVTLLHGWCVLLGMHRGTYCVLHENSEHVSAVMFQFPLIIRNLSKWHLISLMALNPVRCVPQVSLIEMRDSAKVLRERAPLDDALLKFVRHRAKTHAASHGNYLPALVR